MKHKCKVTPEREGNIPSNSTNSKNNLDSSRQQGIINQHQHHKSKQASRYLSVFSDPTKIFFYCAFFSALGSVVFYFLTAPGAKYHMGISDFLESMGIHRKYIFKGTGAQ